MFFLKISMFFSLLMSLAEMDSVFLCEFDFGSWLRFHLLEEFVPCFHTQSYYAHTRAY